MLRQRVEGHEQPYWPAGPFKVRLPFIHYRIEWPDYFQGLFMCAVDLAAIPLMVDLLGMPFEVALAVVVLNGLFYLLHHLLGDPVVPGWITPAIPLLIAYCSTFEPGPERVHALVAFQMMLGIFSIFIGVTGMAHRVVALIPSAIKAGVIVGAGFAAVISVFQVGGRFDMYPLTIAVAVGLGFYVIFSRQFAAMTRHHPVMRWIGNLGILPIIILAVILAPIFGEAPWPNIEWRLSTPDFGTLWREYTVFGLGLPPLWMFVTAIPTVFAAYIVLFGDILQAKAILKDADEARPDEKIDYSPDRAHMIFGARNSAMSILGPDVCMCGPLWSAMHVVICERYAKGKQAMNSLFGGAGSFRWGTNTGLLLMPIVTLVQPILGVALALTLLIQGYVSVKVGILEARSQRDLGIAGIVGAILATRGAAWAFGAGVILCLLVYGRDFFKGETDKTFVKDQD